MEPPTVEEVKGFKVTELKEVCERYSLKKTGNKAELQDRIIEHLATLNGPRSPAVESDVSIASKMVNVDPSDLGSTAGVVNEGTVEKQGDSCDTSVASSKIVQVDASSEREGSLADEPLDMDGPSQSQSGLSLETFSERSDASPRRAPSSPAKSIDKPPSPAKSPPKRASSSPHKSPAKSPTKRSPPPRPSKSPSKSPSRSPIREHPAPSNNGLPSPEGEGEEPSPGVKSSSQDEAAAAGRKESDGHEHALDKEAELREKLQRRPLKVVRPQPAAASSEAAHTGSENGGVGRKQAAKNSPSCTLRVDGFIRPFRLPAAKELLESKGGEKLEERCFWMNSIKTHCYATFQTEEAAERAREALDGIKWPEGFGGTLKADFAKETATEVAQNGGAMKSPRGALGTKPAALAAAASAASTSSAREKEREREPVPALKRDLSSRLGPPVVKQGILDDSLSTVGSMSRGLHADQGGAAVRKKRELGPSPERAGRKVTKLDADADAKSGKKSGGGLNLDELFHGTKATPKLYWMPVSEDQVLAKRARRESNLKRNLDPGGRPFHDPRDDEKPFWRRY